MSSDDLGSLFPGSPEAAGGLPGALLPGETAMATPAQQTSGAAILGPSPEPSPDSFCLTPPSVPPSISSVKIKQIRLHRAVRAVGCDPTLSNSNQFAGTGKQPSPSP